MKRNLLIGLTALSFMTISGCATVTDVFGADSATLNATGAQYFNKIVTDAKSKGQLDTSSATYTKVLKVYNRMRPYADQINQTGHKFDWQLAVIKANDLNAYVVPGGKVVFYSGIVERLNLSDAEIAAIMGHEMVHALEEHSKSKSGADNLTNLALGIGLSAAGIGQGGAQLAQIGTQLGIGLPFSRNLETRADHGGLMLMARAGYNPQAALTLWEKMAKASGGSNSSFFSTHPSSTQRIEAMRQNMPIAQSIYNQSVVR